MSLTKQIFKYFHSSVSRTIIKTMSPEVQNSVHNVHLVQHPQTLHIARKCIMEGQVIALPTDTVYGLACDANNEKAIQRLYDIKGRNCQKPVAICVKDLPTFRRYGQAEHLNDALLQRLLPGAITIVVERTKYLSNPHLNPNTNKVGIRIPDFDFIQQLCDVCGDHALALTSANRSTEPSSLNINEFDELWPKLGGIFDAGQIGLTEERRSASTVVDLSMPGYYRILRSGVALKNTLNVMQDFDLTSIDDTI